MVAPGGRAWLLPGGGMCGYSWGACVVALGGVHGCYGGGACVGYDEIWRYDQLAGDTHPTGIHSCLY